MSSKGLGRSGAIVALLGVAVVAFGVLGYSAFRKSLTPYVTFDQAQKMAGRMVQVSGEMVPGSVWRKGVSTFFKLEDHDGTVFQVEFPEPLPPDLPADAKVVVIGTVSEGRFKAAKILKKCPSKYAEEGER